jgi:hypothetical protein
VKKVISGSGDDQEVDLEIKLTAAGAHPTQDGLADYQKGNWYSTAIYKQLTCQRIFLPCC